LEVYARDCRSAIRVLKESIKMVLRKNKKTNSRSKVAEKFLRFQRVWAWCTEGHENKPPSDPKG